MCNGKKSESYIQIRICLYQPQNDKVSVSLPHDSDSFLQARKRAQSQTVTWQQCNRPEINDQDAESYGWKWDCEAKSMVPVWYTGPQLPLHLNKCERTEIHLINSQP